MSKLAIYTEIDTNTFLKSATGLKINELEELVQKLNNIIAQKRTVSFEQKEAQLLKLHNETVLPPKKQMLLSELTQKLENQIISETERKTLLKLTDEAEKLRNVRLKYLIEISNVRQIPLPILIKEMGLKPHGHDGVMTDYLF